MQICHSFRFYLNHADFFVKLTELPNFWINPFYKPFQCSLNFLFLDKYLSLQSLRVLFWDLKKISAFFLHDQLAPLK